MLITRIMVTTDSPSPSPERSGEKMNTVEKGFFGQLVGSIFEVSRLGPCDVTLMQAWSQLCTHHRCVVRRTALMQAMNASFFGPILVLFAMAILSNWNKHVLFMLVISSLLWATMAW